MAIVAEALNPEAQSTPRIDPTARIGRGACIDKMVEVGAFAVIGAGVELGAGVVIGPHVVLEEGVRIGPGSKLDSRVVVYAGSILGERVWCQAGAIIGGAGFGFHSGPDGHRRVPQVGGCVLGDDVEVGSGTCIDRGSLDDTLIGRGTKIDNLVHIAHNVRIGEDCLIMAGVGISGSTRIGDRVILAGQAGLVGHIEIGDDARIGAQAGVIASVASKRAVSGYPARPHREFLRAQAAMYRLAEHVDKLESLARESPDA
jgi:UDP-3-O-[3-hydroxymyristoyl] glucosamine N-acyltransferase